MGFFWEKNSEQPNNKNSPDNSENPSPEQPTEDTPTTKQESSSPQNYYNPYRWRVRLTICTILLALNIIGMLIARNKGVAAWYYWSIVSVVYAVACLWLGWYIRAEGRDTSHIHSYWKEWVHWIAFIIALYLTYMLYITGTLDAYQSSLLILILLSFSTLLAGLYLETLLLIVGVVLGVLVVILVLLESHDILLSAILIIIALIVAGIVARSTKWR